MGGICSGTIGALCKTLKLDLPYGPVTELLGIDTKVGEAAQHRDASLSIFAAAPFTDTQCEIRLGVHQEMKQ